MLPIVTISDDDRCSYANVGLRGGPYTDRGGSSIRVSRRLWSEVKGLVCRVSSLGEHSLVTRGVEGSIPLHGARSRPLLEPVEPDETWPNGKARGLGPRERRFDSSRLDCVRSTKAVRPVVVRDLAGSSPVVHPEQLHSSPL